MKLPKIKVEVRTGEYYPAWYYGYSYTHWYNRTVVCAILPFNYIIRWARNIGRAWNYLRLRHSVREKDWFERDGHSWIRSDVTMEYCQDCGCDRITLPHHVAKVNLELKKEDHE